MTTLTITRGLPGSGKTYWAKRHIGEACSPKPVRVNRDDTRYSLFGVYSGLTFEGEQQVTKIQQGQASLLLAGGFDVIIDDTNLNAKTVKGWQRIAQANGARFRHEDFPMDPALCKQRVASRYTTSPERHVPDWVIDRMHLRYLHAGFPEIKPLEPKKAFAEPYKTTPGLTRAWIFDVDGTLTTGPNLRSPYDWDKVGQDRPNLPILWVLDALSDRGDLILVISGRDGSCEAETRSWLGAQNVHFTRLFMRAPGDTRKDAVVKAEIFDREIRGKWNVEGVFDDRKSVVQFWRSIGLTCFQVADGDF
jgi:predicted kinase